MECGVGRRKVLCSRIALGKDLKDEHESRACPVSAGSQCVARRISSLVHRLRNGLPQARRPDHEMSGGRTLHGAFGSPIGSTLDVTAALLIDFLVAENTVGAVVGTVGLERYGQNALLRSLAVGSTLRNAGLGARLLFPAELTVRSFGRHKITAVYDEGWPVLPTDGIHGGATQRSVRLTSGKPAVCAVVPCERRRA